MDEPPEAAKFPAVRVKMEKSDAPASQPAVGTNQVSWTWTYIDQSWTFHDLDI